MYMHRPLKYLILLNFFTCIYMIPRREKSKCIYTYRGMYSCTSTLIIWESLKAQWYQRCSGILIYFEAEFGVPAGARLESSAAFRGLQKRSDVSSCTSALVRSQGWHVGGSVVLACKKTGKSRDARSPWSARACVRVCIGVYWYALTSHNTHNTHPVHRCVPVCIGVNMWC